MLHRNVKHEPEKLPLQHHVYQGCGCFSVCSFALRRPRAGLCRVCGVADSERDSHCQAALFPSRARWLSAKPVVGFPTLRNRIWHPTISVRDQSEAWFDQCVQMPGCQVGRCGRVSSRRTSICHGLRLGTWRCEVLTRADAATRRRAPFYHRTLPLPRSLRPRCPIILCTARHRYAVAGSDVNDAMLCPLRISAPLCHARH